MTPKMHESVFQSAVITGAASGLGKALALALAKKGARLLLCDLSLEKLESVVAEAKTLGSPLVLARSCDVRDPNAIQTLAQTAQKELGLVGLVINNAGVAAGSDFESQSLEDLRWVIETNLWGVIHGCHAFLPILRQQGFGHLLNVSSAAGLMSPPKMSAYGISKAGVVALSESLFSELQEAGIGVSVLCPTFFETGLLDTARMAEAHLGDFARNRMTGARVQADDVARAALRGVERKELYILPSFDAKALWAAKRAAPGLFHGMLQRLLPKAK